MAAAATQPATFQRDALTCLLSIVMAYPTLSSVCCFHDCCTSSRSQPRSLKCGWDRISLARDPPPLKDSARDHDDRKEHGPERDRHTKLNEERRQHGKNSHADKRSKHAALAA